MSASEYFARVVPVLGKGLSEHTIAINDPDLGAPIIELLAGCMLRKVVVNGNARVRRNGPLHRWMGASPDEDATVALERYLRWKNPWQPAEVVPARQEPRPPGMREGALVTVEEGENARIELAPDRRELIVTMPPDPFSVLHVSQEAARIMRDGLLGRAPFPTSPIHLGHPLWPFTHLPAPAQHVADTGSIRGKHILVVGCGSLGSEALRILAPLDARLSFIDDGEVTVFNPPRQWFGGDDVGKRKIDVLSARLGSRVVGAIGMRVEEQSAGMIDDVIGRLAPDAVLLATGTHHHGLLARMLWQRGVPHVAVCCYPRARYFEATVVEPRRSTPCLHCYRGALFDAPAPSPAAPDEVMRFVYADESERDKRYTDLVAEPATLVETARAATVAARLVTQLLVENRAAWFTRAIENGTTCLLGANVHERLPDGSDAWGIPHAGAVVRLGLDDMSAPDRHCPACGRSRKTDELFEGELGIDDGIALLEAAGT